MFYGKIAKKIKKSAAVGMIAVMCAATTGCGKNDISEDTAKIQEKADKDSDNDNGSTSAAGRPGALADMTGAAEVVSDVSVEDALNMISATKASVGEVQETAGTIITLSGTTADIQGSGAELDDGRLEIKEAGTYILTGDFEGQIYVKAGDTSDVTLILNGVSVKCENSAAIFAKKTQSLIIKLAKDSINYLSDGNEYVYEENETEPDAALFSKCDLTIEGEGELLIAANYGDAVKGKDNLTINSGTINIAAKDDAVTGRDNLIITGGAFEIVSGGDAFKSTNDEDTTLGNILISGGEFNISSQGDAIASENNLDITDGNFTIVTAGGSSNGETHRDNNVFGGFMGSQHQTASEDTVSAKGLKAVNILTVKGGSFAINSADDAVHADGSVVIDGGSMTMATGDDGIHAEEVLTINAGTITISESYEGIEAADIILNGGDISITAGDDGLNASDGSATEGGFGFGGMGMEATDADITITGGNIYVNAGGDGIDSNGTVTQSGGNIIVSGPVNSGNGALDYAATYTITGGSFVAAGSTGMAQSPSSAMNQAVISMTFNTTVAACSVVEIRDAAGNQVIGYTADKNCQNIIFSSPEIVTGNSYGIYKDGTLVVEITVSESITYVNESGVTTGGNGMMMPGMDGNMGGKGGNKGNKGNRNQMQNQEQSGENSEAGTMPELPEGMELPGDGMMPQLPEGMELPEGGSMPQPPEGMELPGDGSMPQPPEEMELPEGGSMPQPPEGMELPGDRSMPQMPENSEDVTPTPTPSEEA